jgi:hypothetical protein
MSTGRGPSANDPSPELLREIRRMKICKGFDGPTPIWEERILDPPPVWIHLVRFEPTASFAESLDAPTERAVEVTFYRQGVEVDNAGTWVRYGLSPQQPIHL